MPLESSRWFLATKHPPKGVFLVVHGLNLRPSAMDPLAETLASNGYIVHRITLHGHNGRTSQIFDEKVWLHEVAQSYRDIRDRFPELPTYVMGYSLGGLTLMTMLESVSPAEYPRGMILLAPAISLRGVINVLTTLHLPPAITWALPNLTPKKYRRYDYTPLFWYSNTLALYRNVTELTRIERLSAIPTLVFLNEADEIVSSQGTAQWIADHHLFPSWRIEMIHPEESQFPLKEHLIIDEASLGKTEWARVRTLLGDFLKAPR
jgi:alpha-beta hydrolase superfamily lysophospholipase